MSVQQEERLCQRFTFCFVAADDVSCERKVQFKGVFLHFWQRILIYLQLDKTSDTLKSAWEVVSAAWRRKQLS